MKNAGIERLLLVYNAESGTLSALVDSAKKLLMINGCPLCSLTHSLPGARRSGMRKLELPE